MIAAGAFGLIPWPQGALPMPVYFLQNGQVCCLTGYGINVTRISEEASPVESFDVSSETGEIILVAGNSLILMDNHGGRRLLLEGEELPAVEDDIEACNDQMRITERIATPRWSPDGGSIAFIRNGLMVIDPVDCSIDELHPNGQLPPPGENWDCTVLNSVESWSPDGARILVTAYSYPAENPGCIFPAVKDVSGIGYLYCQQKGSYSHTWGSDGMELYLANPGTGGQESLNRLTPPDWQGTMIGESVPGRSYWFYSFPHVAADGDVMAFVAFGQNPVSPQSGSTLYRINRWGAGMTALRSEEFTVSEALWAADGSGVLILDDENGLRWVPAGDGSILTFAVSGLEMLRWGPARQ